MKFPSFHPINNSLCQLCQLLFVCRVLQLLDAVHGSLAVLGGEDLGLLQPPGVAHQAEGCLHVPWLGELPEYELLQLWELLASK